MKANKLQILFAFVVVFLLGFLLGLITINSRDSMNPTDPKPSAGSCQYNGRSYKSGEGFPAEDGCNSCSCEDGNISCTLMACP